MLWVLPCSEWGHCIIGGPVTAFVTFKAKLISFWVHKPTELKKALVQLELTIWYSNCMKILLGMTALTDDHWEQYNKLCHLCLIDYDFIGKFDSGMVDDIS